MCPVWPVADKSSGPPYTVEGHFLLIDTDEGATGICGPVGDEDIAIINRYFVDILVGEDPHAIERIWDKMYRHLIHGRKGNGDDGAEQGRSGAMGPQGQALERARLSTAGRTHKKANPRLCLDAGLFGRAQ